MSGLTQSLLFPDWPAPASVHACVTTREGGVSLPPYESFNLGDHVGDDPVAVAENRRRLSDAFGIRPAWLKQVHGLVVADADPAVVAEADASFTDQPGIACTVIALAMLPLMKKLSSSHSDSVANNPLPPVRSEEFNTPS